MTLRVTSEIGRLRRVLIHRPGPEIDRMVPSMMEWLLFEDILYGKDARHEHDTFTAVLRAAGVETFDPQTLLAEVLAEPAARETLLARLDAPAEMLDELRAHEPAELAADLVAGILADETDARRTGRFYRLPPVPNYFFQRDPQVVLGRRVLISSMATGAREREALLARTVFEHHPTLAGATDTIELDELFSQTPYLEGGDVLVASPEIVMVGLSERTNRRGIESLARYLRRAETSFRQLIVVEIPPRRSYMHLDTVLTFIDRHLCLAYLPVIAGGGAEAGAVYRIDLTSRELSYTVCEDVPRALGGLGLEVELVPCGGGESLVDQQREQWTDGANAFALAPGVIVTYRRNRRTAEELDRRGWRVLTAEDVIDGEQTLFDRCPTLVTLPDNELSRARGGPRCMTMPLERDPL